MYKNSALGGIPKNSFKCGETMFFKLTPSTFLLFSIVPYDSHYPLKIAMHSLYTDQNMNEAFYLTILDILLQSILQKVFRDNDIQEV